MSVARFFASATVASACLSAVAVTFAAPRMVRLPQAADGATPRTP